MFRDDIFLAELRQKFCLVTGGCTDDSPCWWCGKFIEVYEKVKKCQVKKQRCISGISLE